MKKAISKRPLDQAIDRHDRAIKANVTRGPKARKTAAEKAAKKRWQTLAVIVLLLLAGCAPYASNISPSPISHARYDGWSCSKLKAEQKFVEENLVRISADQDSAAGTDILMVFLIGVPTSGGGVKGEVARLKGERNALHNALMAAGCITEEEKPEAKVEAKPEPTGSAGPRLTAQLYLIKGPIVSNPPQTFNAEFFEGGKAFVVLSGRRPLTGDFELFGISELTKAKYNVRLMNPDSVNPAPGTDARGFAVLSDGTGTELECSYSLTRSTGRGQGMCADNQRNTYRIIFD